MPKLTLADIENKVVGEEFLYPTLKPSHTICILKLDCGFTVTGESAPVDPNDFDEEIGKDIARKRAYEKVWMLEGYRKSQSNEVVED